MRVHDPNLMGPAAAATDRSAETHRTGRPGTAASPGSSSPDRVELSGAVGSIARALGADSAHRSDRVRELAAQYRAGAYHPDAAATGRAMVSEALASAAG